MKYFKFSKSYFIRLFFEIIIIFIGLTLSFLVQEKKEYNDRKDNIFQNLSIISNNIHQDTIAFDVEMMLLEQSLNVQETFLDNGILNDSIYALLFESLNYRCVVEKNQAGYEMLMHMQIPKDFFNDLLNVQIIDFYDSDYSSLKEVVKIQNEKLAILNIHIISLPIPKNFDIQNINTTLLTNLIFQDYQSKKKIQLQYILIIDEARNILEKLEKKHIKEYQFTKSIL